MDPLISDAHLLADYGEAPRHWAHLPFYAYRVIRRRQQLRRAIVIRGKEADRAEAAVHDAFVALGERLKPRVEREPEYATAMASLREAEGHLRSRDRILAAEHDEQAARLSSIDSHLAKLASELARAQADERTLGAELTRLEGALGRSEAELKRAAEDRASVTPYEPERTHE